MCANETEGSLITSVKIDLESSSHTFISSVSMINSLGWCRSNEKFQSPIMVAIIIAT